MDVGTAAAISSGELQVEGGFDRLYACFNSLGDRGNNSCDYLCDRNAEIEQKAEGVISENEGKETNRSSNTGLIKQHVICIVQDKLALERLFVGKDIL